MKKWKDVYKEIKEIDGEKVLLVYFRQRYDCGRIRLAITQWLITPLLLTKEEFSGVQSISLQNRLLAKVNK